MVVRGGVVMDTILKDVVGFPGYKVGDWGGVFSLWEGSGRSSRIGTRLKKLKTSTDSHGREVISLSRNKKRVSLKVCWLVLEAFVGPRPLGMDACHFPDRNPQNNRVDNLRWDTKKANYRDRIIHQTCNRGERNGSNKVTVNDVIRIRKMREGGCIARVIADKFDVTDANIYQICKGETWAWLS